jgi:hypothetical protein
MLYQILYKMHLVREIPPPIIKVHPIFFRTRLEKPHQVRESFLLWALNGKVGLLVVHYFQGRRKQIINSAANLARSPIYEVQQSNRSIWERQSSIRMFL